MRFNKEKGFTLLEMIAVLAIMMTILVGAIYAYKDYVERSLSERYGREFVRLVSAVDNRLAIDGFEHAKWTNGDTWSTVSEVKGNLLKKDLIATGNSCGDSSTGWTPALARENNTALVPCGMWAGKTPWNTAMNGELTQDANGFVQNFNMWLIVPDNVMAEKFKYVKFGLDKAKEYDIPARTGFHNYDFVNYDADRYAAISVNQCLALHAARLSSSTAPRCAIKLSHERNSSYESLHVDGSNSMVGSGITFKKDIASSKATCLRWRQTNEAASNTWNALGTEDCGLIIYDDVPVAIAPNGQVEANIDGVSSSYVLLDRYCNLYQRNASLELVDSGTDVPCGMVRHADADGTFMYQIVDKQSVNESYSKYMYTQDLLSDTLNTKFAVVSENMDIAGYLNISKGLTVGERLNVLGVVNVSKEINVTEDINSEGSIAIKENLYVEDNVWSKGNIIVEKNLSLKGNGIFQGDAIVQGGVIINNNISAKEVETNTVQTEAVNLTKRNASGSACTTNGQMSLNASGDGLLICHSSVWKDI